MWVRGLKLFCVLARTPPSNVAPHVGAWIETSKDNPSDTQSDVAPHVGAWIETRETFVKFWCMLCRTPCGCVD